MAAQPGTEERAVPGRCGPVDQVREPPQVIGRGHLAGRARARERRRAVGPVEPCRGHPGLPEERVHALGPARCRAAADALQDRVRGVVRRVDDGRLDQRVQTAAGRAGIARQGGRHDSRLQRAGGREPALLAAADDDPAAGALDADAGTEPGRPDERRRPRRLTVTGACRERSATRNARASSRRIDVTRAAPTTAPCRSATTRMVTGEAVWTPRAIRSRTRPAASMNATVDGRTRWPATATRAPLGPGRRDQDQPAVGHLVRERGGEDDRWHAREPSDPRRRDRRRRGHRPRVTGAAPRRSSRARPAAGPASDGSARAPPA